MGSPGWRGAPNHHLAAHSALGAAAACSLEALRHPALPAALHTWAVVVLVLIGLRLVGMVEMWAAGIVGRKRAGVYYLRDAAGELLRVGQFTGRDGYQGRLADYLAGHEDDHHAGLSKRVCPDLSGPVRWCRLGQVDRVERRRIRALTSLSHRPKRGPWLPRPLDQTIHVVTRDRWAEMGMSARAWLRVWQWAYRLESSVDPLAVWHTSAVSAALGMDKERPDVARATADVDASRRRSAPVRRHVTGDSVSPVTVAHPPIPRGPSRPAKVLLHDDDGGPTVVDDGAGGLWFVGPPDGRPSDGGQPAEAPHYMGGRRTPATDNDPGQFDDHDAAPPGDPVGAVDDGAFFDAYDDHYTDGHAPLPPAAAPPLGRRTGSTTTGASTPAEGSGPGGGGADDVRAEIRRLRASRLGGKQPSIRWIADHLGVTKHQVEQALKDAGS